VSEQLRAVALGGGHGLSASLSALRRLTANLTAVVTVADDGGSSGRIRRELGTLPPGDLRMALTALADTSEPHAQWADLLQHRFGGSGALAGHPIGNLLLTGFLDRYGDPIGAIEQVAELVGAVGKVLPMSPVPLDLIAEVDRFDPDDPVRTRRIRGQSSIATTPGRVRSIRLLPPGAPACAYAVDAVREADVVVLGPGSWFTSVIPHLLLHELGKALASTDATVIVTVNLVPQAGETDDFSPGCSSTRSSRTPTRCSTTSHSRLTHATSTRISYCRGSLLTTAPSDTTRPASPRHTGQHLSGPRSERASRSCMRADKRGTEQASQGRMRAARANSQ